MKFEDAKVWMKVYINHPQVNYNEGIITSISEHDRAVFVEPLEHKHDDSAWFREGTYKYSLNDLTPVKNKVPKFDTDLVNSKEFYSYVDAVSDKYTKEFLPEGAYLTDLSIHENGRIVVKDNKGNKGISKCHHDDAFNLEIGVKLAIQRLSEKVRFVPKENQEYWGIRIIDGQPLCMTCNSAFYDHLINMAIGNCFRTADEASKHRDETRKRFNKLIAYAKTLNS